MLDALKFAAAVVTVLAFGYSLTVLIAPRTSLCWFERLGIAFVLGTGAGCILWILLTPVYGMVPPRWALSAIVWPVAIAALWRTGLARVDHESQARVRSHGLRRWIIVAGWVVLALELGALVSTAARSGLEFDGLFNFEMKARIAFGNEPRGPIPLAYFSDASRLWFHPRYPLVIPFAEFWIYEWLGHMDQFLVKLLFPTYYGALACMVGGSVRRLTGPGAALAATVALGTLPSIMVIPGAISGLADVPLAAAVAAAISCCLVGVRTGRAETFWLAGALSAIAACTKVEGGMLALWVGIAGVVVAGRKAAPMVVLPVAVVVPWTVFLHVYGLPERDFLQLSPQIAMANFDRIPLIVRLAARELVTPGHWGLLWPVFFATCVETGWHRRWRVEEAILAGVVSGALFAYPFVFLFSSWTDIDGHVRMSFGRLLVPLAPLVIIFLAARLFERRAVPAA